MADATPSAAYHLLHNRRLLFTAVLLSTGCFTFGYDASVIGGALAMPPFVKQFGTLTPKGYVLTARTTSIIVATPTSGALVGAAINSFCADRFGRRKTMWLGCAISLLGAILQTSSFSVATITVGRIFTSISVFVLVGMAITFQNELSPPSLKGLLGGVSVVSIQSAAVIASGINWGTHSIPTSLAWRLPIGLQNVFPIIIATCTFFVMESPTALLIKGDDVRAEESLRRVRQGYSEEEIADEMARLKMQKSLRAAEKEISWLDLFRGTNLRRTILATYAGMMISLSGLIYATNYATVFLEQVGETSPYMLVFILNILTFAGAITGGALVDVIGRRRLALSSYTMILIIDCTIGGLGFAKLTSPSVAKAIAAFNLMFGFFVAVGFNVLTYINTAEMPTARLRNKTNAFALLCNSLTSLTVTYVFPYISEPTGADLGAKTYLIFAGFMVVNLIFTFFCYPEVKGRSPAELDAMFEARLPARKFKDHVPLLLPGKDEGDYDGDAVAEKDQTVKAFE
ncbi:general substrate transporter [Neohortaea acidophila]|uniref:General substrate transporter n=1 Tax=Neohortaea acidophila TaxID=245834 RepID=A0A6A6PJ08_9PEZI|nr:general substrate transporter [Neohortaea acidophila]KAF2479701.1 general substrate transporter [Neohortaea acidophila]